MAPLVGLRHDVDTVLGLLYGVGRVVAVEDRFDARSTFYVRLRVLKRSRERGLRILQRLVEDGWRVGLHVDNSVDDDRLPSPWNELYELESLLGVRTLTATIHGGIFGAERAAYITKLCSLGRYVLGPIDLGYCVSVPTFSLDWLIARFGEERAVELAVENTFELQVSRGAVSVLTHPEYFVVSIGVWLTRGARAYSMKVRLLKLVEKTVKPFYTVLGRKLSTRPYREYLRIMRDMGYRLDTMEALLETGYGIQAV